MKKILFTILAILAVSFSHGQFVVTGGTSSGSGSGGASLGVNEVLVTSGSDIANASNTGKIMLVTTNIDLGGTEFDMVDDAILKFQGGTIDNGSIIFDDSNSIIADRVQIFGDDFDTWTELDGSGRTRWTARFIDGNNAGISEPTTNADGTITYTESAAYTALPAFKKLHDINDNSLITTPTSIDPNDTRELYQVYSSRGLNIDTVYPEWFGVDDSDSANGTAQNLNTDKLQKAIYFAAQHSVSNMSFAAMTYSLGKSVKMIGAVSIIGSGQTVTQLDFDTDTLHHSAFILIQNMTSNYIRFKDIEIKPIAGEYNHHMEILVTHGITLENVRLTGDAIISTIIGSNMLYFSANGGSITNQTPGAAAMIWDETYFDISYYGLNVGWIEEVYISASQILISDNGDLTIKDCDFETPIINNVFSTSGGHVLRVLDSYFEVYAEATFPQESITIFNLSLYSTLYFQGNTGYFQNTAFDAEINLIGGSSNAGRVFVTDNLIYRVDNILDFSSSDVTGQNVIIRDNDFGSSFQLSSNPESINFIGQTSTGFSNKYQDDYRLSGNYGMSGVFTRDPTPIVERDWATRRNGLPVVHAYNSKYIDYPGVDLESIGIGNFLHAEEIYIQTNASTTFRDNGSPYLSETIIDNPGFGYDDQDPVQLDFANGDANLRGYAVTNGAGVITQAYLTNSASDTQQDVVVTVDAATGGGGTGATFTVDYDSQNNITGINVVSGGTGYADMPTTFTIPTAKLVDNTEIGAVVPRIVNGRIVFVVHPRNLELASVGSQSLTASTTGTAPSTTASVTFYASAPLQMSSNADEVVASGSVVGFTIINGVAYEIFNSTDY